MAYGKYKNKNRYLYPYCNTPFSQSGPPAYFTGGFDFEKSYTVAFFGIICRKA